jgi:Zn-dependent protease
VPARPWDGARGRHFLPSPLFLAIVALFALTGWLAWRQVGNIKLDVFGFVTSGWVVSLCLHEYAHAVAAYRGGDKAVAERGYLTLNPLKYSNPLLSIVLPVIFVMLGGIGLPGGAVWVDRRAIRTRAWDSLISLVGPAMNVLFTFVLAAPFALGVDPSSHQPFWGAVAFLAFLQLMASVLNLLPVPGLDGGNLIEPWLSPRWQRRFALSAPYGLLVLVALLWWVPLVRKLFFGTVIAAGSAIGLPGRMIELGQSLYQFWY